jgi:hypothetical protein
VLRAGHAALFSVSANKLHACAFCKAIHALQVLRSISGPTARVIAFRGWLLVWHHEMTFRRMKRG